MIHRHYHGTHTPGIKKLMPAKDGYFGPGIYTSNCMDDASEYGDRVAMVDVQMSNPLRVHADYALAELFDIDTPAGPLLRHLFGDEALPLWMERLRAQDDVRLGAEITERLEALGFDGLLIDWPDGVTHAVVWRADQASVVEWISRETEPPMPQG